MWHLKLGPRRHGDFASLLPNVSPKVLSERLQGLERRGLVNRTSRATYPRQVDYCLTPLGEKVVVILDQFEDLPSMV